MLAPIFIENSILVKKFHFHFNEMSSKKNLTSYKWFATNRIFRLRYRISTLAFSQSRFKTEDGRKDLTRWRTRLLAFSVSASGRRAAFPQIAQKWSPRIDREIHEKLLLLSFLVISRHSN